MSKGINDIPETNVREICSEDFVFQSFCARSPIQAPRSDKRKTIAVGINIIGSSWTMFILCGKSICRESNSTTNNENNSPAPAIAGSQIVTPGERYPATAAMRIIPPNIQAPVMNTAA